MERTQDQAVAAHEIDLRALEAFRASLPSVYRWETYRFLTWRWDIVVARYLLHTYPRSAGTLGVASAARAYDLDHPILPATVQGNGTTVLYESIMGVDPVFAMGGQIDLEQPVILALVQLPSRAAPTPMLIDGLHRLYRAAQDHREKLPCLVDRKSTRLNSSH